MKKFLVIIMMLICNLGITDAYRTIDENDLYQIEAQINSTVNLSREEKAEKAKILNTMIRKIYEIRKAFTYVGSAPKVELSGKDWDNVNKRIKIMKKLSSAKRGEILTQLRSNQFIAEELSRLYEIESSPTFEGYGIALSATPVFQLPRENPDINRIMGGPGSTGLQLDESNLIREVIVVYPKGTVFSLIKKLKKGNFIYYEVRTNEFDGKDSATHSFYIDSRFVEVSKEMPHGRAPKLPSQENILKNMHNALGSAYIWGGSRYQGVPEMTIYFPSDTELSKGQKTQKMLKGVDCSGLLYQSTNGYTPRNSHGLLNYGKAVEVEGNSVEQIAKKLRPLDLIVWAGHVIIVYDANKVIESRWYPNFKGGVILTNTKDRLREIMETRQPVNNWSESKKPSGEKFVVRRWYGIVNI